jgi:hypothetical protein
LRSHFLDHLHQTRIALKWTTIKFWKLNQNFKTSWSYILGFHNGSLQGIVIDNENFNNLIIDKTLSLQYF